MTLLGLGHNDTVLTIATHPDDETLGAGGTLNRLARAGISVHVLAVCCHTAPMWGGTSDSALRTKEFNAACDALGVTGRHIAWINDERSAYPGGHLRELVELIETDSPLSLQELRPTLLFIPAATGFHQDHQAVHQAAFAAARHGGTLKHTPRIVLGYAGPEDSWSRDTEPWRVHIDTSDNWPAKRAALSAYASQLREANHPRNIDRIHTIDTAAGASVGLELAETFVPYRVMY
ncbi:PIG-L deacetylase family protein [Actinomadura sp. SCN-SB]|uniref:PIG-L deacetylase family protein n=1 Tax=Actinomadura sp. SCN-SB TaxID=3373092 RepID=UPI00375241A7